MGKEHREFVEVPDVDFRCVRCSILLGIIKGKVLDVGTIRIVSEVRFRCYRCGTRNHFKPPWLILGEKKAA